ncbi:hypothetical protein QQF64_012951 [Cirrhinus molitorella]|uniref:Uncharacterized protein n=2 Tax=Cirrhinus molitorella TaxID=172907 RepID=A0AA88PFS9_9TELE|nr:hypothetical protein Q8A67_015982 [Cirrhinus molitorella]
MPPFRQVLKQLILQLWIIFNCASCAHLPQTCIQCSLSCDGAPELKKHESVIVSVESPFQKDFEKVYNVSSLYHGKHCLVLGCFHRDMPHGLKIYPNDNGHVPEVLFDKSNLQPVCGLEGISTTKQPVKTEQRKAHDPNGADGKLSNKLLILLAFCFLHLPS